MRHAGDALHDLLQPVETARAGVALVAFHDGAPLAAGHGAGAGIGQPVDQHVVGAQLEDVQLGASASSRSRSARVVMRMGSMLLMRKGSIRVLGMGVRWLIRE
jgi:hypothetical protein